MKKKTEQIIKRCLSLLLAAAMLVTVQGASVLAKTAGQQAVNTKAAGGRELPKNPVHHCTGKNDDTDITDWSYVYFGSYPQTEVLGNALTAEITGASYDGNGDTWVDGVKYRRISKYDMVDDRYFGDSTYRYFKWEPIKWRVLNNDGNTLFVMADNGLDCKSYHDKDRSITWENCNLRNWLNHDFYRAAFDGREQEAIVEKTVVNEDNSWHGTKGGNDTRDKVFLLSYSEMMNLSYGFCEGYHINSVSRRVKASDYAHAMGTSIITDSDYRGYSKWRLRSPGYFKHYAANIFYYGSVDDYGSPAYNDNCACVPALHIDLSSELWTLAEDASVSSFRLDASLSGSLGQDLILTGTLTLSDQAQAAASLLQSEIDKITWTSSDESVARVTNVAGQTSADNRTALLSVTVKPCKVGKAAITGRTSNGLTASCAVTVGSCIAIDPVDPSANFTEGRTIALSGTFTLEESVEATEANLHAAINSLKFESSDDAKARVLACSAVTNEDCRSAQLEIWTTLYNEGEATITAIASDGHSAECRVAIQPDASGNSENYEGNYVGKMRALLLNKETYNVIRYLCNRNNFTASNFVAEKDAEFGNLLVMGLTDVYYRGWDGWRDLIDGSTSVEEAEKIIASLLSDYQSEVEALSQAKTAEKYAKMIKNAFEDYTTATNLFAALNSSEIDRARKYFSEDHIAKLLYEGKYDELMAPANQILQHGTETASAWNDLMDGFTQSAEVSRILKDGCRSKRLNLEIGGGLSDLVDVLETVSLSQETMNHMFQLESLLTADEMYGEMLLYVKEHCAYGVVQEAAGNLYSVINDRTQGIMADFKRFAADKLGEQVFDLALQAASEGSYIFAIFKAGFEWGAALSNTFYKVGDTQELKDSLRTQAFLANTLGRWASDKRTEYMSAIGTEEEALKAKELYYSLYMLWESRKCAEETLQSLLKTTKAEWSVNYSVSARTSSMLETYKDSIFSEGNMAGLFGISVSCPVDVEVYSATGEKLLTVKDGAECAGFENGIYYRCVYNPLSKDYDKYIYYSEDLSYRVKILAKDLGAVDASVISVNENGHLDEFYFENTGIEQGTVIDLGDISKEGIEYRVIRSDGSEKSETMDIRKAEKIAARSIALSTDSLELEAGKKQLLTVSFVPANATDQKVAWVSDNEAVVSVNSDGVITAIAAGTAVVTVFQGELKQTCQITVKGQNTGNQTEDRPGVGNVSAKTGIENAKISLKKASYVYDGKKKQPSVTVAVGSQTLKQGTDYHVTYQNNRKVGAASVIIDGTGAYTGRAEKGFRIVPGGTSVSKVTAKPKGFVVNWKKQAKSADGYQLSYSTSKKFTKKTTVTKTVKKASKTKLDIKKCKANKRYFIRVRTYKTVQGKKYNSGWSRIRTITTK